MTVTVFHIEDSNVLDKSLRIPLYVRACMRVLLSVFLASYTVNAVFFHDISLLFLHETITTVADGKSCSLFDIGLGVTYF
jgi:hypothetical protein